MDEIHLPVLGEERYEPAAKLLERLMPVQIAEGLTTLTIGYKPDPGQGRKSRGVSMILS